MAPDSEFGDIYQRCHAAVWRYASQRVGGDAASDVVAEVFLVAWRRWDAVPRKDPLPWLCLAARGIIGNLKRAEARSRRLQLRIAGERQLPLRDVADAECERRSVVAAWCRLAPADRAALILIGWDGMAVRCAARELGYSGKVFTSRLYRARRRLADAMVQEGVDWRQRSASPKAPSLATDGPEHRPPAVPDAAA